MKRLAHTPTRLWVVYFARECGGAAHFVGAPKYATVCALRTRRRASCKILVLGAECTFDRRDNKRQCSFREVSSLQGFGLAGENSIFTGATLGNFCDVRYSVAEYKPS